MLDENRLSSHQSTNAFFALNNSNIQWMNIENQLNNCDYNFWTVEENYWKRLLLYLHRRLFRWIWLLCRFAVVTQWAKSSEKVWNSKLFSYANEAISFPTPLWIFFERLGKNLHTFCECLRFWKNVRTFVPHLTTSWEQNCFILPNCKWAFYNMPCTIATTTIHM